MEEEDAAVNEYKTRQERPKYNTKQIATSNEREKSVKRVKKLLAPFIGLTNRLTTSCDFVVNVWFFTFIYKFFLENCANYLNNQ